MAYYVKDRKLITSTVLKIVHPDSTDAEVHAAFISWWQNFRESGGFGLTYTGSAAFEKAEIEYVEFDMGEASYTSMMATTKILNDKMPVPYYFYANKRRRMIRVYDSRASFLMVLHGGVKEYLDNLDQRNKNS